MDMNEKKTAGIFFDRSYGYARAIVTLLVGLVITVWPEEVQRYIIYILGAIILAVGLLSVVLYYTGKWRTEKTPLLMLNAIVDIVFGLILLIRADFFLNVIMFVFGLLLLIFGLGDIINIIRTSRTVYIPWPVYIGPALTLIIGIVLFFFPEESRIWMFRLFGAGLLIYAVSEFWSTYLIRKRLKEIV